MTGRERILGGLVGATVVVFGGYQLIMTQVIDKQQELQERINDAQQRYDDVLKPRVEAAPQVYGDYQDATRRTLGADWFDAHQAFREDIAILLDRNGLNKNLTISKYKERRAKKGVRENFVELPVSVRVAGKLENAINFLRDLYQRPYYVRVEKLGFKADLINPKAEEDRRTRRQDKSKRDQRVALKPEDYEPEMRIVMTLTTLALPPVPMAPHQPLDLARIDELSDEDPVLASANRLRAEDPTAYDTIAEVHPFMMHYEPPPPPPEPPAPRPKPTPPSDPQPERIVKPTRKPVPPPEPPEWEDWVVTGTAGLGIDQIVYVLDPEELADPPTEYFLNDELADGRIILIEPTGIVVRVEEEERGKTRYVNYFHPLGEALADRVELDAALHPRIARTVRRVLEETVEQ